jgi:hypothetical protein
MECVVMASDTFGRDGTEGFQVEALVSVNELRRLRIAVSTTTRGVRFIPTLWAERCGFWS